jgi:hypothetical protein
MALERIIGKFVSYIQQNDQTGGYTSRKTKDIDQGITFLLPGNAHGNLNIIGEHFFTPLVNKQHRMDIGQLCQTSNVKHETQRRKSLFLNELTNLLEFEFKFILSS